MRRWATVVAVALPGLVLAALGVVHPRALAQSTAETRWQLHVVLLPLFPLLAVALWVLLRGEGGVLAWFARVAAHGYAVLYTGLDVLAGIGAAYLVDQAQSGSQEANDLRSLGNDLGMIGSVAFLAAAVLTGLVLVRRDGRRAVPGAVLLAVAAIPFAYGHIYWPTGGPAMVAVALGCGLLAAARPPRPARTARAEPGNAA